MQVAPPEIERDWALFLDLDGTLLDIASRPDDAEAPSELSDTLEQLRIALGGALAVISGRPLEDVDRLLSPSVLAGAGDHGAIIRYPSGTIDRLPSSDQMPLGWTSSLREATREWPGVGIEEKHYSTAVHYRLAPDREREIYELAAAMVNREPSRFDLLTAKMAIEIRSRAVTKARAVKVLMEMEPFRGRKPVFVGDDVTDDEGIAVAQQLGGFGLRVEDVFEGKPSAVRAWLSRAAASLQRKS